mmetsp:Transcript_17927/g.42680  ORF Transcript_17927/g.42680 Transcript_17927/m.42680 type:complete len:232 (-) Transcript_17927:6-701(-)
MVAGIREMKLCDMSKCTRLLMYDPISVASNSSFASSSDSAKSTPSIRANIFCSLPLPLFRCFTLFCRSASAFRIPLMACCWSLFLSNTRSSDDSSSRERPKPNCMTAAAAVACCVVMYVSSIFSASSFSSSSSSSSSSTTFFFRDSFCLILFFMICTVVMCSSLSISSCNLSSSSFVLAIRAASAFASGVWPASDGAVCLLSDMKPDRAVRIPTSSSVSVRITGPVSPKRT